MKKVITYGSFDLFHEGHYNLLKRAKALGDYLIVGVTTEQYDESRGKLNIVDSLDKRIEHVRQTGFADEVIVEDHPGQKAEDVQKYGIDIFTVGSDWAGAFDHMKQYCEVVYLERTKNISSTIIRTQQYPIIRIGVIGTGRIAVRFVPEAKYVSGVIVNSVCNPCRNSAEQFRERFELDLAADDPDVLFDAVDAVYIASPHETHYGYARRALEAGKHVLCEKPLAFCKKEAKELYALASAKGLVLLEAVKTAYCPGFVQLVGIAKSGVIGKVCDVEACFTRLADKKRRECTDVKYGGGFTEFGSHTLLPILKLMGTDYQELRFDSIFDEKGIDLYTKASFVYEKGMALSKSGVGVKSEGQLLISGTEGYILAESPWWLTQYFEVRFEDASRKERYFSKFLGDGLRYEISDFAAMIQGHQNRAFKFTAEESIAAAEIMEKFLLKRAGRNKTKKRDIMVHHYA